MFRSQASVVGVLIALGQKTELGATRKNVRVYDDPEVTVVTVIPTSARELNLDFSQYWCCFPLYP